MFGQITDVNFDRVIASPSVPVFVALLMPEVVDLVFEVCLDSFAKYESLSILLWDCQIFVPQIPLFLLALQSVKFGTAVVI